jgi:transcriptional regulator of acetoin/glycerol metabolism
MSRLDLPQGTLIGRDRELAFLRGFFQEAAVSSGAVLLSGEPGVGKTALLNALADSASAAGTTVLRVAGAQFEGAAGSSPGTSATTWRCWPPSRAGSRTARRWPAR